MDALNQIKNKIDAFVKKYYGNRLIRGLIIFATLGTAAFLFFSITEYYAYLDTSGRRVLFLLALSSISALLIYFIIIPLSKLLKIGRTLTLRESAQELSDRMPEIKDKLLNIIDLEEQSERKEDIELLAAAISQKSEDLKVFDFRKAVDLKINYKYLRYLMIVLIIFAALMISNPAVITDSTHRIINYRTEFVRPSKVNLELVNENLRVKRGNDLELKVKSVGEVNPASINLFFSGKELKMKQMSDDPTVFSYTFQNLNNSFAFKLSAGDYTSASYQLEVLSPPLITEFSINVKPPRYTGEADSVYKNVGDISIPAGSILVWNFSTLSADSVHFRYNDKLSALPRKGRSFSYSARILNPVKYAVKPINKNFSNENFINYQLSVIPDLFPQIAAEQKIDSTVMSRRFFRGYIQDDYGISKLVFKYRKINIVENKALTDYTTIKLPSDNASGRQEFYYSFDFSQIQQEPGQSVEYFFEVFDNDAVSGAKSAKTRTFLFTVPTFEEQLAQFDKLNESAQSSTSEAMEKAREISEAFKEFQKSSVDNSREDWENKQFLQDMQSKQDDLQRMIEEAQKELEKAKDLAENNKQDEELLKKLEELQKMTEELMTDEIKKLMEEINKLAEQYDEKVMQELMKKQDQSYKDLEKMLDRNMELMKRFKVEQKTEQISDELMKLSEEMKELSEETRSKESENEKLSEKQKELEEKFDKLQEEYEKTLDENKELEKPFKMDDFNEESEQIKEEFNKSEEMLQKGKENKASDSQKQNSQNMQKMAEQMQQMMQSSNMQMSMENTEDLKAIVQDLLTMSFEQERNTKNLQSISINDPKFSDYGERQIQLQNEYNIVADSLYALSKRMFSLANVIDKETKQIESNFEFALENFREKKIRNVSTGQMKIMQSFNNLALILSEMIEQMQNMQSSGSGSQSDQMSDQNKPSFDGLKQQQQNLKKQLEDMLKQMKEQGDKPGQMPSSKQLAEMLARQEMFRQKLEEMKSKHNLGQDTKKLLDEISDLTEKSEKELMNKRITPDLLERQQLIQTRLLEAEQAENKRKTDPKRESKNPKEKEYESPENFFRDEDDKTSVKENLNKNSIILTPFYRKVFDTYTNQLNSNQ